VFFYGIAWLSGTVAVSSSPPVHPPRQFSAAPQGYTFKNVDYRPGMTAIWYSTMDGEMGIMQSREDFKLLDSADWSSVPANVIQATTVNGQAAEFVSGSFLPEVMQEPASVKPI
jgi:hypothetical protein